MYQRLAVYLFHAPHLHVHVSRTPAIWFRLCVYQVPSSFTVSKAEAKVSSLLHGCSFDKLRASGQASRGDDARGGEGGPQKKCKPLLAPFVCVRHLLCVRLEGRHLGVHISCCERVAFWHCRAAMLHHTLVIRSPLSYISPQYNPDWHRLRSRVTFMLEEGQV